LLLKVNSQKGCDIIIWKDEGLRGWGLEGAGVGPNYHIDYAGIIPPKRLFSGPISSFSTPKSAL